MPHLIAGVVTDPGQQRSNNEDLPYVDEQEGIFVVVDGVGGEASGEEAAKTAVEAIQFRFEDPGGDTEERIREAIALASNRIFQGGQDSPEKRGMACVLTLAVIEGRTVTVGHVGDSRLYRIRNGRMEKITPDHSPVGEREDRGEITEAEAMSHPRRNEVYRDVGSEPHQPGDPGFIDILRTSLPPDAALLLASDGLTDMLTREQMLRVIETYDGDPHRIARALVDAANEAGGKDNITVLFIPGSNFASANGHASTRRMAPVVSPDRPGLEKPHQGDLPVLASTSPPSGQPLASASPFRRLPDELLAPPLHTPSGDKDHSTPLRRRILLLLQRIPRWSLTIATVLIFAAVLLSVFRNRWAGPRFHLGPVTLHVGRGKQYPSIAAAFADARDGDAIVVAPGVYPENVLLKSGVALLSAQPRKAEIQARGTAVDGQAITGGRISGFRISPDSTSSLQIGLRARDAVLQIDDSEISGASDAGIVIQGNSTAHLSNNFIHGNTKAGIRVDSSTFPDMQGNRICDNGLDIVPASPLAAAANITGRCVVYQETHPVESHSPENRQPTLHAPAEPRSRREPHHE